MDLDGWKARNLTNTSGVDRVYASHKDRICFVSDHDTCHRCYFLYEMDAYCNDLRRVCDHRVQNSWITKRMNGTELLVDPHGIHDTAFFRVHRVGWCSTRSTAVLRMPTPVLLPQWTAHRFPRRQGEDQ